MNCKSCPFGFFYKLDTHDLCCCLDRHVILTRSQQTAGLMYEPSKITNLEDKNCRFWI